MNEKLEVEQTKEDTSTPQGEFLESLSFLKKAYLFTVIASALIAASGIFVALQFVLWIGIAIAMASALAYVLFTNIILRKSLGMSYESTSGAVTVTKVYVKEQEEIFIPRRMFWVNVTRIGDNAFVLDGTSNLKKVHLPATLCEIGKNIFEGCDSLERIYFEGSREEWEKIECATELGDVEIIFCDTAMYDLPKKERAKKTESSLSDTEDNG